VGKFIYWYSRKLYDVLLDEHPYNICDYKEWFEMCGFELVEKEMVNLGESVYMVFKRGYI
jgi:hypothetical protein